MKIGLLKISFLIIGFLISIFFFGQESSLTIGEIHTIQSAQLGEERTLNVYLPPSYNDTSDFPVFYVLDGSMHEDFIHITGLIQFFKLQFNMPEVIVVGISNVDRKRDFTFYTEEKSLQENFPTSGHSKEFIEFLKEELIPYMDETFKVSKGRYLIGQSLGGLLATEILLKEPSLFNHYLIVSPSLWWDNESLLKELPEQIKVQELKDIEVYISVGEGEHKIMRKDAKELYKSLKKLNLSSLKLDFEKLKDENHATILHNSIYKTLIKMVPFQN